MNPTKIGNTLALAIKTEQDILPALATFGIAINKPVLVLVGGASGMTDELIEQTMLFFEQQIGPFVKTHGIIIVDGGTNSGIMRAIGRARKKLAADFPMVGVAVQTIIENDPSLVEENHPYLLLTPGEDWGDEVPFLSKVGTYIAGSAPSMTLLFNGGQITWRDAAASVAENRPVLVAEGSGRAADAISQTHTGGLFDAQALQLLKTGLIRVSNPYVKPEKFIEIMNQTYQQG
jgi:hypothetical protein